MQRAIEAPTAEAQKVLAETPHADDHERLTVLMNGWFRGLAGALEELAIELDALREEAPPAQPAPPPAPARPAEDAAQEPGGKADEAATASASSIAGSGMVPTRQSAA